MNILIVEDMEDWVYLYTERFTGAGVHITYKDNVPDAIKLIQQGDIMFNIAICDKGGSGRWSGVPDRIGHRDGLQVLTLLHDLQPNCIRILATAEPYEIGAFDRFPLDIFYDKTSARLTELSETAKRWYEDDYLTREKPIILGRTHYGIREQRY